MVVYVRILRGFPDLPAGSYRMGVSDPERLIHRLCAHWRIREITDVALNSLLEQGHAELSNQPDPRDR